MQKKEEISAPNTFRLWKAMRIAEDEMCSGGWNELQTYLKTKEEFAKSLLAISQWVDEPTVYRFGRESFLVIGKTFERIEYIKVRNAKC